MKVTTVLLVYVLAGGVGAWTTGKLLKSEVNPFIALAIAGIGGLSTFIPNIGRVVAFLIMVVLFKQFSRGEFDRSAKRELQMRCEMSCQFDGRQVFVVPA